MWTKKYFLKNVKKIFAHKKLKKPPKKVAHLWQLGVFFSAAPTAQNSPELHFRLINYFIQPSLVGSLFLPRHNGSESFLRENVCFHPHFLELFMKYLIKGVSVEETHVYLVST